MVGASVSAGVTVKLSGRTVQISGPKGSLSWTHRPEVAVALESEGSGQVVKVGPTGESKTARALWGTTRALVANMVAGVATGYSRPLEIYGTGYNCKLAGRRFQLNIGFMGRGRDGKPQFDIAIPEGVDVTVETPAARGDADPAKFTVLGPDKQKVGQFAAELRALRKPEPYKGKGIRYVGEVVRRKQGKAFAGGGR
ncbi:MAG: 50S ribosomal protein L6 [Planctomycetes bacterium]|nr:50S ribosomal protein L6 [Planctomycetota bacterium]